MQPFQLTSGLRWSLRATLKASAISPRASSHTPTLKSLLQGHYSQSEVSDVNDGDPMAIRTGEVVHTRTLRVDGPEYLPIRTFDDLDLANPGADPLMAVLGALEGPREGERIVSRLVLNRLPPDWAAQWHDRGMSGAGSANQMQSDEINSQSSESTIGMGEVLKLGGLALLAVGFLVWQAVQDGNTVRAAAMLLGAGLLSATAALLYFKVFKKKGLPFIPRPLSGRAAHQRRRLRGRDPDQRHPAQNRRDTACRRPSGRCPGGLRGAGQPSRRPTGSLANRRGLP